MNGEEMRAALNKHWSASAAGDQETEHEIYGADPDVRRLRNQVPGAVARRRLQTPVEPRLRCVRRSHDAQHVNGGVKWNARRCR